LDYRDGLSELGKNIESVITESLDAIQSGRVETQVNSAVDQAINEVRKALDHVGDKLDDGIYRNQQRMREREAKRGRKKQVPDVRRMTSSQLLRYCQLPVCKKPPGNVASILAIVFGAIGLSYAVMGLIVSMAAGAPTPLAFILAILAGINGTVLAKGISVRKRVGRFFQYLRTINNREYCDIKELLPKAGGNLKLLKKDLKVMSANGMFLEAHMDDAETTLMLTEETYQEYLRVTKQRQLEREEKEQKERLVEENPEIGELNKAVSEGEHFISLIRQANDEIPGEVISQKLDRLEDVTRRIFEHIQRHPSQLKDIRKFMGYYLPTTTKLVHVYCELDKQPVNGENIANAKADIEKSLDTVNEAFENLLDGLFEDTALDVSSDITVLKTMLAQEGLTGEKLS